MAKLAIIEQTILFCCVLIYGNDCGNVPNIRKRLQYVLWKLSYCVVELSLIAMQSYDFLLKYPLRHSHSPQFNVLCQEKQQGSPVGFPCEAPCRSTRITSNEVFLIILLSNPLYFP